MVLNSSASYPQTLTFVVKLRAECATGAQPLAGRIEHVASGEQFQFSSPSELLACLRGRLAEGHESAGNDIP